MTSDGFNVTAWSARIFAVRETSGMKTSLKIRLWFLHTFYLQFCVLRPRNTDFFTAFYTQLITKIWILTNRSLDLAHNLVVGDCFSTFIVGDDLRLLINFLLSGERQFSGFLGKRNWTTIIHGLKTPGSNMWNSIKRKLVIHPEKVIRN